MEKPKIRGYARKIVDEAALGVAQGFQDYAKMRALGDYVSIAGRDHMVARRTIERVNKVFTDMENAGGNFDDLLEAFSEALQVDVK